MSAYGAPSEEGREKYEGLRSFTDCPGLMFLTLSGDETNESIT